MGAVQYEWDENKRQENIEKRGLDMVILAPLVFADPFVVIEPDTRRNYGEERFLAYGLVAGERLCVCFTLRGAVIRLITIFKLNRKDWEKHYGKDT